MVIGPTSFLKDDAIIMNKEGSIRFPAHCESKLYERYITIVHSDEVNVALETSKLLCCGTNGFWSFKLLKFKMKNKITPLYKTMMVYR